MPKATALYLHQHSAILEINFDDGSQASLSCEYLRVYSPPVEKRGQGNDVLVVGKEDVTISDITPVGNYAVKLLFSDGYETGLYSWSYLYELSAHYKENWSHYLNRLQVAGYIRKEK